MEEKREVKEGWGKRGTHGARRGEQSRGQDRVRLQILLE